ncbi:MAG: Cytidine deaminase [Acidimicrobiaceae bacterium]|nr:MAG: Cytidine deaminase [Acidimicrobiaceae bacterium]|tara:strand:+ start:2794 stop:3201 length:408 start_codon:yes stop_codon:yes gene_type:complete
MDGNEINWENLRIKAKEVANRAYAPYSNFPVGAAGLTDSGEIVTGCNVENASIGLTLCAECGMISELHKMNAGKLIAAVASNPEGEALAPCGRCRQLLIEAGGKELIVDGPGGPKSIVDLLVDPFTVDDLKDRNR